VLAIHNRMRKLAPVRCSHKIEQKQVCSMKELVSNWKLCRNHDQLASSRTNQLEHLSLKQQLLSKQLGLQSKIDSSEPP
jgi:hypothetical protein